MKKYLSKIICIILLLISSNLYSQCVGEIDMWPSSTYVPTCIGSDEVLATDCYTGEYSLLTLTAGTTYTFTCPGIYMTISDDLTDSPIQTGTGTLVFVCSSTEDYRVYRHLSPACDNDQPNVYTFSVSCSGGVALPNDNCSDVIPTVLTSGVPVVFNGTTDGATMNADEAALMNDVIFGSAAFVWHAVTLNGTCNNLTVDFCGTAPGIMDFAIDVYTDCPYTTFSYSDNFDDCGDGNAVYNFNNLPAGTYYLPVLASLDWNSALGAYTMTVTSEDCPPPPANDDCVDAIQLNCGDVINGSTSSATSETDGCYDDYTSNGVWYTFTGNGLDWTISLCGSSYDTYLSLYEGPDCSTLTCIDANDDDCGTQSQLTDVPTTPGTIYWILVKGYNTQSGDYTLTVSSEAPANDDCADAIAITPGTTNGTTNCSNIDAVALCGTATAPTAGGVWYTFTTTCSSNITASLCTGTTYNSQISVFDGTCGALNCIAGNDDFCTTQSEATWAGAGGTTYYILVHGSGTETGDFVLNLTQVDATAPTPDVALLPDLTGSCYIVATPPTATDNCVGSIDGTTTDPTVYTVGGSYSITWIYDDGNGNSSSQTQNVILSPDATPPVINCINDSTMGSDPGTCGAVFSFSNPIATDNCADVYTGTDAYYIRSNVAGEPWSFATSNNNLTAMNAVFGAGGWIPEFYETANVSTVFSTATKFVFLEGSDANASELSAFLATNLPAIETYVFNGGTIFINAAPNEGGNIDFGFGGTTLNYGGGSDCNGPVDAVTPSDPIFAGPFLPCTTTGYAGGSFSHAYVTGTGLTNMLQGCGDVQFASKTWGSGIATFGGMTLPNFHSPLPDAANLRQNIISWLYNMPISLTPVPVPTVTQVAGPTSGSVFPVGTTTVTFEAVDASGNSSTCSFDVTVVDNLAPATNGGALVLSIYYGGFNLDEGSWELYDSTNTLIASGGPYPALGSPGLLAEQIDISGALEPLTFFAETQGFWNDNILDFEITCGSSVISSGTVNGGEDETFTGIIGCEIVLPTINDPCSAVLGSPAPTLEDNCDGTVTGTTSDPLTYDVNGTYTVTWTFADLAGNTSVLLQTVIINDSIAPVPDVAPLAAISDTCTVLISTIPTATDACEGTITATTTDPLSYNDAGTYNITWTYDDGRGNISTQTQTVTVIDVDPPVPSLVFLPNVVGNCITTIPAPPTASDNCSGDLITGTTTDPITYNLPGTYLVIWTFDDGNGNTWTQNQIVVVDPCLGIEGEDGQLLANIYPNPSTGIFTLSLAEMPTENTEVKLLNSLGQVIYSGMLTEQNHTFDFSYLASATYYLLISTSDNMVSKPIIIKQGY